MIKIVFRLERVIADTYYCFPRENQSRQILYKPRIANWAVYDGSLLRWLLVSLVKLFGFLCKTLSGQQYPQSFCPVRSITGI